MGESLLSKGGDGGPDHSDRRWRASEETEVVGLLRIPGMGRGGDFKSRFLSPVFRDLLSK